MGANLKSFRRSSFAFSPGYAPNHLALISDTAENYPHLRLRRECRNLVKIDVRLHIIAHVSLICKWYLRLIPSEIKVPESILSVTSHKIDAVGAKTETAQYIVAYEESKKRLITLHRQ